MKKICKILIFGIVLACSILPMASFAGNIPLPSDIKGANQIINGANNSPSGTVETVGKRLLGTAKYIFSGVLLIIIVYAGALMITSMGSDEEDLSRGKRILRYSLIGMLFINMPGTIYNAIKGDRANVSGGVGGGSWGGDPSSLQNLFINTEFATTINNTVIKFLKIGLVGIAVIVIIWSGISIIISRGKEDKLSEAKNKILWSIIGLIFVGFIEIWQRFVYTGDIKDAGTDIFKTIANLALFLAAPTAIFFLCLAGYYYITAGGDQEKTKKGKSIIVNVVIATVILLVSYIFLIDLRDL